MTLGNEFRKIPGIENYAINAAGVVMNNKTGKCLTQHRGTYCIAIAPNKKKHFSANTLLHMAGFPSSEDMRRETLLELVRLNKSQAQIAAELGVSERTVWSLFCKYHNTCKTPQQLVRQETLKARIKEMVHDGATLLEITQELNASNRTVCQLLRELGLQTQAAVRIANSRACAQDFEKKYYGTDMPKPRLCHDCKRPSGGDYRCPTCLAAWRKKHNVNISAIEDYSNEINASLWKHE